MAFVAWLELAGWALELLGCLTSISRAHKIQGLHDPTKDSAVQYVVNGVKKCVAQDTEAKWTRDPLPVNAVKWYLDFPPGGVSYEFWARDLALVSLGLRTMRRPGELCDLKKRDIRVVDNLLWVRVNKSKTDQLARGKFILIERTNSKYCPVRRLEEYLRVRPNTEDDAPLFLSRSSWKMTVSSISAVVKRFADHVKLKGKFTAHSLRIGGATAAMEGGLLMEQIQTIGGWVSDAARLYMRAIGTVGLGTSKVMGFEG